MRGAHIITQIPIGNLTSIYDVKTAPTGRASVPLNTYCSTSTEVLQYLSISTPVLQ